MRTPEIISLNCTSLTDPRNVYQKVSDVILLVYLSCSLDCFLLANFNVIAVAIIGLVDACMIH